MTAPLWAGAVLGLSVAAPFGPVSLVCVQQSLNHGSHHGIMAGFGAATAHGIFASVAIAGAGVASAILAPGAYVIRSVSAVILIGLGIRMLVRAGFVAPPSQPIRLRAAYASALMLSLANPMTIIPYLALATIAAGGRTDDAALSAWSIPGVVTAAATWYVFLSIATSLLRRGMPAGVARFLNLAGGCSMIGFGASIARHLLSM